MTTFDFTPFLERGFLFTPTLYDGPHETLGLVVLTFRPGTAEATAEAVRRVTETRPAGWAVSDARVAPLLERVYEAALGLGGDAVMQLTVETTSDNTGLATYHLSGYAIRRGAAPPEVPAGEVP